MFFGYKRCYPEPLAYTHEYYLFGGMAFYNHDVYNAKCGMPDEGIFIVRSEI